jgi:hypothetical protein
MDIETTLKDVISDVKFFLKGGVTTLPLTIGGSMLIIGLFTANYAMLFFLLGFLFAAPFLAWVINTVTALVPNNPFSVLSTDMCRVSNPFRTMANAPATKEVSVVSEWLAMVLFFFGYMGFNAFQLLDIDPKVDGPMDDSTSGKVSARKTQACMSLLAIVLVLIGVIMFRLRSNCEGFTATTFTMVIGFIVSSLFLVGGGAWYYLLSLVGENRLSDLFGIANRLLGKDAMKNVPVACVPMP